MTGETTTTAVDQRGRSSGQIVWVPILISMVALGVSIASFFYNSQLAIEQGTPSVNFTEDTDPESPAVGLRIANDGPGLARIKRVTYYVDGKPLDSLEDVSIFDQLPDGAEGELGTDSTLAAGGKEWVLFMNTRVKRTEQKDVDQFMNFVRQKFVVKVKYCSVVTGHCETLCSKEGWCK